MLNPAPFPQNPAIGLQESAVLKVVIFQPRKRPRIFRRTFPDLPLVMNRSQRIFPVRPSAAKPGFLHQIAGKQPSVISVNQVFPLSWRDRVDKPRPKFRKERPRPAAIKPIKFCLGHQKHAAQNQLRNTQGMRKRVNQRQRRPPAATEHDKPINPQCAANGLDILHQMPGGIFLDAGMWPRPATAPLIKQNYPENIGIKIPPHRRAAPTPRPAMQHDDRNPPWIAALLDINPVPAANIHHPLIKGINGGV